MWVLLRYVDSLEMVWACSRLIDCRKAVDVHVETVLCDFAIRSNKLAPLVSLGRRVVERIALVVALIVHIVKRAAVESFRVAAGWFQERSVWT